MVASLLWIMEQARRGMSGETSRPGVQCTPEVEFSASRLKLSGPWRSYWQNTSLRKKPGPSSKPTTHLGCRLKSTSMGSCTASAPATCCLTYGNIFSVNRYAQQHAFWMGYSFFFFWLCAQGRQFKAKFDSVLEFLLCQIKRFLLKYARLILPKGVYSPSTG